MLFMHRDESLDNAGGQRIYYCMLGDRHFTIEELCSLYEMDKRQIRSYIQRGLVDPPCGSVRAYYTQRHVEQLLAIHKRFQSGLPVDLPDAMVAEMKEAAASRGSRRFGRMDDRTSLVVDRGVELRIHPSAGLTPRESRNFVREVSKLYRSFRRRRRS